MTRFLYLLLLSGLTVGLAMTNSCTTPRKGCMEVGAFNYDPDAEESDGNCKYEYKITQEQLDAVTEYVLERRSGAFLGINQSHIQGIEDADSTIREMLSDTKRYETIRVGSVFTKRVWGVKRHPQFPDSTIIDSTKHIADFAIVKQPIGYFPQGGDYEYIYMPHDPSVDYKKHPNGFLQSNAGQGKLQTLCANCHSNGGSDFLFIR